MAHFKSQKELVNAIEQNLNKLEAGELSISEMEDHLDLIRELYERTVVLRYKAFEQAATPSPIAAIQEEEPEPEIQEEKEDEKEEEASTSDEQPSIDFSLFDTDEEEEEVALEIATESTELVQETTIEVVSEQVSETEPESEEPKAHPIFDTPQQSKSANPVDFEKRFTEVHRSLIGQLGFDKLDTLIGSFGLNERLQYINELFDGSSDAFAEAIKLLDSQPDIDTAKVAAARFSSANGWDLESDTVEEFMQKLCRRYV